MCWALEIQDPLDIYNLVGRTRSERNDCSVECQKYIPTMFQMFLTFDPVIPLMRVYSQEINQKCS